MNNPIDAYKQFIDGLVRRRHSVIARRIKEGVRKWHAEPGSEWSKYASFVESLTEEQRDILIELSQSERDGGIHDTLAFLTDGNYRLSKDATELAWEPFGTEMYFDFIARADGDEWPREV